MNNNLKIVVAVLAAVLVTAIAVVVIGNIPITFMGATSTQWEGIARRGAVDFGDVLFYSFTALPFGLMAGGWVMDR